MRRIRQEPFELQDHLVYHGTGAVARKNACMSASAGGRRLIRGVRVDEGQILALQGRVSKPSTRVQQACATLRPVYAATGARASTNRPAKVQLEGSRLRTVPVSDEAQDIVSECGHALEAAVSQDASLQDAGPESRPG